MSDPIRTNGSTRVFPAVEEPSSAPECPVDEVADPVVLSRRDFVEEFSSRRAGYTVVDLNHASPELMEALACAGLDPGALGLVAGPDGQLKGSEFQRLYSLLDRADGQPGNRKLDLDPALARVLDALRSEVETNRALPEYQRPGSRRAAPRPDPRTFDPVAPAPEARLPDRTVRITPKDQFTWGAENGFTEEQSRSKCFHAAKWMVDDSTSRVFGRRAPRLTGPDQAIQVAYAEDARGRLAVDPTQARLGREYIDAMLDKGYPVMVGVSYGRYAINHDRLTDHFVTIFRRGHDEEGRLFYEFRDPGDGGRRGRFFVDERTGTLFRVGTHEKKYVGYMDYEVTQVRTFRGVT